MADEKIIDWPALSDAQAEDSTRLIASGVTGTGKLFRMTVGQQKKVYSPQTVYYTADGSEGSTLTISALAGRQILGIWKEGLMLYPVASAPDSVSYTFDSTNIGLGLATNPGERYGILYKVI